MVRKLQAGTVALALTGALAASAQAGPRQDFSLTYSARTPSAPSGMALHVVYRDPKDPNAKPPALTKLVVQLPPGTRFDTSAVPVCTASDDELQVMGPDACPAASQVGTGKFVGMSGSPSDPFVGDSLIFNGGESLIEDVLAPGTRVTAGVDRLHIRGSTFVVNPPATPGGPPDGRTVPREVDVNVQPHGSFLTTPGTCPPARDWLSSSTASFADGGSETDTATTPCSGRAAAPAAPRRHARMRLSVRPRHAAAGRQIRYTLSVSSPDPRCRTGVALRIGRGRATSDRRGRARLTATVSRAGTTRAVARKRGCGSASAALRVRRRAGRR